MEILFYFRERWYSVVPTGLWANWSVVFINLVVWRLSSLEPRAVHILHFPRTFPTHRYPNHLLAVAKFFLRSPPLEMSQSPELPEWFRGAPLYHRHHVVSYDRPVHLPGHLACCTVLRAYFAFFSVLPGIGLGPVCYSSETSSWVCFLVVCLSVLGRRGLRGLFVLVLGWFRLGFF